MTSRREFLWTSMMLPLAASALRAQAAGTLSLADWSFVWTSLKRAELYRGTVIAGQQMYVERFVPRSRRPLAVVLVHEPGGQGSDWIATPHGGAGWLRVLLEQGYAVYLVDLPGLGRVPYHPDLHGPFPQAPTYERLTVAATTGPSAVNGNTVPTNPASLFAGTPAVLDQFMAGRAAAVPGQRAQQVWREAAAHLLDQIGPACLVTHGDSVPFAWGAAAERPLLVKGIAAIDPSPAVMNSDAGRVYVTSTFQSRSAGHYPMLAADNRAQAAPLLAWLDTRSIGARPGGVTTTAAGEASRLELADINGFWVGVQRKTTAYGTVAHGQTYVQRLVPARKRHPYPIVLVHGGGGQGTHWMGEGDGAPGWAQYYLQQGYEVCLLDCPGYGRSPEHPDATGVTGQLRTIEAAVPEVQRAVNNPNRQWDGSGLVGDPMMDRFLAGEVGFIQRDLAEVHGWWARAAGELLDRIGPAIVQTHTNGGAFGWIAADQRPGMVKAIVWTVLALPDTPFADRLPWGLTAIPVAYDPPAAAVTDLRIVPVTPPENSGRPPYRLQADPPRQLRNLRDVPVLLVSGEYDGRAQTPAVAEYFRQAGVTTEHLRLQDRGLRGNGALVMWERNNRQIVEIIRTWIESKVRPG